MNLSCGADVMSGKDPEDAVIEAVVFCAPINAVHPGSAPQMSHCLLGL